MMTRRKPWRYERYPRTWPARVALYRRAVAMARETGLNSMVIFAYWDEPCMFRPGLIMQNRRDHAAL
jgi:hypothetical protein